MYSKLASAIYNDVMSGLRGMHHNPTISLEQLEDDIVDERLLIIDEYVRRGLVPKKDLLMAITCIAVDCKDKNACKCGNAFDQKPTLHFEIPQLVSGLEGITYIGSTDRENPFTLYTSHNVAMYNKYRRRAGTKPYVVVDTFPNENNMYDCWIYGAPLLKRITVVGVFKDLRQLEDMGCCGAVDLSNLSHIDAEIKKRLTEKKLRYYRQLLAPNVPNDQVYR